MEFANRVGDLGWRSRGVQDTGLQGLESLMVVSRE